MVLLMTPALALFYGGMVRSKNVLNMIMMSFLCMGLVTVIWVLYGYSLTFGTDAGAGLVGGFDFLGMRGTLDAIVGQLAVGLKYRLGYDDSLDVVGVHGVGGLVGMVGIGLLATTTAKAAGGDGLFMGGGFDLPGRQLIASGATLVYAFVVTAVLALIVEKTMVLRVRSTMNVPVSTCPCTPGVPMTSAVPRWEHWQESAAIHPSRIRRRHYLSRQVDSPEENL